METSETRKKELSGGKLLLIGITMLLVSRLFGVSLIGDLLMVFGAVISFGGLTRVKWNAHIWGKKK